MEISDKFKDADVLYREPLRGQFHFSPQRGWNNDPNGCVYYNGEYHLFFQHNPYGWSWGSMHWGHAVSRDLVHWEELGDKLLPDDMGPMFSGSAVVDWNNTSGFGRDGKPPLVLIYTAAGNPTVQGIAYSTDGRNFTKYSGNPVLQQITGGNRDPKVIWHEPTKNWVMVLYVTLEGGKHTVHFFTSANFAEWTLASITEGVAGLRAPYPALVSLEGIDVSETLALQDPSGLDFCHPCPPNLTHDGGNWARCCKFARSHSRDGNSNITIQRRQHGFRRSCRSIIVVRCEKKALVIDVANDFCIAIDDDMVRGAIFYRLASPECSMAFGTENL